MSDDEILTAGNFVIDGDKPSYEQIVDDTREILDASKKRHQSNPTTEAAGRKFYVDPSSFSPKYFNSSTICARNVPIRGNSFLEIGAGIGTVTITLLLEGQINTAVATDINKSALRALSKNANRHGVSDQLEFRHGSVFDPIEEAEKFDTVFWNTPFGYLQDQENLSDLEKAAFDPGYNSIETFISQAKRHLKLDGSAFFSFSSALGKPKKLHEIADSAQVKLETVFETEIKQGFVVDYKIIEIV